MGVITMRDCGVKTFDLLPRCDHAVITEKKLVVIRKLLTVHAVIMVESKGMLTKRNQWEKLLTCDHRITKMCERSVILYVTTLIKV